MSPVLNFFQESGPLTSGRGTTVTEVDNWNMKDSSNPVVLYYPHDAAAGAPLIRPSAPGDLKLSFKVYTFFQIGGTYSKIKNLKLRLSINDATQANRWALYYKLTNSYQTPSAAFDGTMLPAWNTTSNQFSSRQSELILWPNWSTVGPHMATSRNITYGPNQTLFSSYLVTQLYVQHSTDLDEIGNTAEFKLRMEFLEFGE